MGKDQKKYGKGRLDKYYRLAKEKGYRSRAAFKLLQLNKKYGILEKSKVLIDLCAAPGSWCQVASQQMPANSLIVGVDLVPIRAIPKVITFQQDITSEKCRYEIKKHLKTWQADTVLHDGAPNVGAAWIQDAYSQSELVLESLRVATEFLIKGGTFVTKIFRSKDYNNLIWVFKELFEFVEATKPPSSRQVSAEIFVVCKGYKAPRRIDPKFLDPKSVFEELPNVNSTLLTNILKPEKKKRQRDGYEEGNVLLSKSCSIMEFICSKDAIQLLGTMSAIDFPDTIDAFKIKEMPETSKEVLACCEDLKVLGRKDFRGLLKWRSAVRNSLGLSEIGAKAINQIEEDSSSKELIEHDELQEGHKLQAKLSSIKSKRERRKENKRKTREISRMQLNMGISEEIGMDHHDQLVEQSVYEEWPIEISDNISSFDQESLFDEEFRDEHKNLSDNNTSSDEECNMENDLNMMYDGYVTRRSTSDFNIQDNRVKVSGNNLDERNDKCPNISFSQIDKKMQNYELSEHINNSKKMLDSSRSENTELSKQAILFYDKSIFHSISGCTENIKVNDTLVTSDKNPYLYIEQVDGLLNDMPYVAKSPQSNMLTEHLKKPHTVQNLPSDIDIITAEAMTLAQNLAVGNISKSDFIDEGFNRFSFRDTEGLPSWFIDDEDRHSKVQLPITAEAVTAVNEKIKAMNARPIKKVIEAKMRKKLKAAKKLERSKKKSFMIVNNSDLSEQDKASTIDKLIRRASGKPKNSMKYVVAKGANRGIKGRPHGIKGRYRMVDPRMKKELRAFKKISKH